MKIPTTLPITAEQSRASRFQLGLTQAQVIQDGDLPGYKLKQFETGRFIPDVPFLQRLREFYASRGIEFSDAKVSVSSSSGEATPQAKPDATTSSVVPFFLMNDLTAEQLNAVFSRVQDNEERISKILSIPVNQGFFGGWDDDTLAKQRELFGAFAENYLLLARLQGRVFLGKETTAPANQADLLAKMFAGTLLAQLGSNNVMATSPQSSGDDDFPAEVEDVE